MLNYIQLKYVMTKLKVMLSLKMLLKLLNGAIFSMELILSALAVAFMLVTYLFIKWKAYLMPYLVLTVYS